MDWGMLRLSEKLLTIGKSIIEIEGVESGAFATSYDWQRNRLVVRGMVLRLDRVVEAEKAKADMVIAVNCFRKILGRNGLNYLATSFSHSGYKSTSRPNNMEMELQQMTEIVIVFHGVADEGIRDLYKCVAPLVGTEIMWVDVE